MRTVYKRLQDLVEETSLENQLGSIAQSRFGVQIPEKDERKSRFEVEGMGWKSIWQPGVKILHIEPQTILVVVKLVAAP